MRKGCTSSIAFTTPVLSFIGVLNGAANFGQSAGEAPSTGRSATAFGPVAGGRGQNSDGSSTERPRTGVLAGPAISQEVAGFLVRGKRCCACRRSQDRARQRLEPLTVSLVSEDWDQQPRAAGSGQRAAAQLDGLRLQQSSAQEAASQHALHVAASVSNHVNDDLGASDTVDYSIRLEEDLAVFLD